MSFDLTNKNIQDTFQNLLQRTGSDNRLYDLTGNEIGDLRISGSLIAQQYVVSSSVTNITTQQLSGSTQFGDSLDDTHQFTGSLNVTGSITKGNIPFVLSNQTGSFVTNIDSPSQGNVRKTDAVTGVGSNISLGLRTTDNVKFNHITASGNISASGTIIGSNISGTNTGDQDLSGLALKTEVSGAFTSDSASFSTRISVNEVVTAKTLVSSSAQIASDISGSFTATSSSLSTRLATAESELNNTLISSSLQFDSSDNVTFNNITASGNISASGDILCDNVKTMGRTALGTTLSDTKGVLFSDNNITQIQIGKGAVNVSTTIHGNITASGNIKSGGNLELTASSAGNITASGNIALGTGGGVHELSFGNSSTLKQILNNNTGFQFTSGSTVMGTFADATGNFGIGTETPGQKLEVIGNISASGQLIAASADFKDGNITNVGQISVDTIKSDVTDDVTIGLGAGGIAFDADSGDEFLFNGENNVDFIVKSENGHELFIDGAANSNTTRVGIGFNGGFANDKLPPVDGLTVHGNISASGFLKIDSHITASGEISASGRVTTLQVGKDSTDQIDFSTDNVLIFRTGNNNRLRLTTGALRPNAAGGIKLGTTNTPFGALHLQGDITASGNISASGDVLNSQVVQMTNSSSVINTFNTGSHQTCKYVLQVTSGSFIQSSEMLVVQSGSNAFNTEYAQIGTAVNLGSFSTTVSGNVVKLNFAGDFISCSVKFNRTLI